jgi:hypothetical protein
MCIRGVHSGRGIVFYGTLPNITGRINTKFLTDEAKKILNEPNAGGDSVRSEAYAMEVLKKHYHATDVTTEMNIVYYNPGWKKCDFLTTISERVGVSVTRALVDRKINPDTIDIALNSLIVKKLTGLIVSRAGVDPRQSFYKSILFVWSPDRISTNVFKCLFAKIGISNPLLTQDIVLILTEVDEDYLRTDFRNVEGFNYVLIQ